MTKDALLALQEATEFFIINYLTEVNYAAIHRSRVTIAVKDSIFVRGIFQRNGVFNPLPGRK